MDPSAPFETHANGFFITSLNVRNPLLVRQPRDGSRDTFRALWRHVKDKHVKDAAEGLVEDVAEDVLGAAKGA